MASAGSSWRIGILRPGEAPIGNLAEALNGADMLGADDDFTATNRVLLEATLRRSSAGLAAAVTQARIPADHNVLVIVDQFEELFRFRRSRQIARSHDEAIAFVKLLLEASLQHTLPIYVVLTMRSDFIGDCMDFPGLSEAVNAGLYLVGRMSREALRGAITGPVAVAGGSIAPRLVNRVLNDLGDDQDQLPLVQHALMRTWESWQHRHAEGPIDIADYEAAGTVRHALSIHAEEAYQEAVDAGVGVVAERMFKALTDTFSDQRGVRRPTPVSELAAACEVPESQIIQVVDIFRRPGRSFLMPPPPVALTSESIVDLSHESLMRCWTRLMDWAEEERASAVFYMRLSQASAWFAEGSVGLWRNPELELALRWKTANRPGPAWARRYDDGFDRAMDFLERSRQEWERLNAEWKRERTRKLRRTQWVAAILGTFLVMAVALAYLAWRERRRAEMNLDLARAAVDESLSSAERDPARAGADVPQLEELRRELLRKAERFYSAFMAQQPRSERARKDLAYAHFRLAHINRMLEKPAEGAREYQEAIARFDSLAKAYPTRQEYRQALANAYNALGETLRSVSIQAREAEAAYDSALQLQRALVQEHPATGQYREELARTLYNRGILRASADGRHEAAEADFREAIRLLEPLALTSDAATQELARAYNNLGGLLAFDGSTDDAIKTLYERAIATHERLVAKNSNSREYKLELAKFSNNLAALLHQRGEASAANQHSRRALDLIETLSRLAPSLAVERADAHTMRGVILQSSDRPNALRAYEEALDLFADMGNDADSRRLPEFHVRFGDLLLNLAALREQNPTLTSPRQLLSRGLDLYADIAAGVLASGSPSEARNTLDTLSRILPVLTEAEKGRLALVSRQLQAKLDGRGARHDARPLSPEVTNATHESASADTQPRHGSCTSI